MEAPLRPPACGPDKTRGISLGMRLCTPEGTAALVRETGRLLDYLDRFSGPVVPPQTADHPKPPVKHMERKDDRALPSIQAAGVAGEPVEPTTSPKPLAAKDSRPVAHGRASPNKINPSSPHEGRIEENEQDDI